MTIRLLRCYRCSQDAPFTDMRYDNSGKYIICSSCRASAEQVVRRVEPTPMKTIPSNKIVNAPVSIPKKPSPLGVMHKPSTPVASSTVRYQCQKCKYAFKRVRAHQVTSCPNCGGSKVAQVKEERAQRIVVSSQDKRFESF